MVFWSFEHFLMNKFSQINKYKAVDPLEPVQKTFTTGYCNNSAALLITHKIIVGVQKLS